MDLVKKVLFSGLLASVWASSGYGIPGPGLETPAVDAARTGMGGAGASFVDEVSYSYLNPARMAFNSKTGFGATLNFSNTRMTLEEESASNSDFMLNGLSMSFPMGYWFNVGVGFQQRTFRNFSVADAKEVADANMSYEMSGGIYELAPSVSVRLPWFSRLALGFQWRWTLGSETLDAKLPIDDPNWLSQKSTLLLKERVRSSGSASPLDGISVQWHGSRLDVAAWYHLPHEVEQTREQTVKLEYRDSIYMSRIMQAGGYPGWIDDNEEDVNVEFPWRAGASFSVRIGENHFISADGEVQAWDEVDDWQVMGPFNSNKKLDLNNSLRVALGWKRKGSSKSFDSYYKRMSYSAGAQYQKLPYDETQEISGSVGLGLPMGNRGSMVDLSWTAGVRGEEDASAGQASEFFTSVRATLLGVSFWGKSSRKR